MINLPLETRNWCVHDTPDSAACQHIIQKGEILLLLCMRLRTTTVPSAALLASHSVSPSRLKHVTGAL
jgi:hypothetical protein